MELPVSGSSLGCAVMAVRSRPLKSWAPTVSRSGVSSKGTFASHRASSRPACSMTWVPAVLAVRSGPRSVMYGAPSRAGVCTQRLRYHSARPSRSRMPWTMPLPLNQWVGVTPGLGLWPLRIRRPVSSGGRVPSTVRPVAVISSATGV